jgi:hypothetical protein
MSERIVAWNMKGQVVVACNCDWGCPCNVNALPTRGYCQGGWTWQIEAGVYGELKLDGLHLAMYAAWPAAIHEGNGTVMTLVDERADEAQRRALIALLQGAAGGPWGILRKTFTTFYEPRFARFEVDFETKLPRVRVDDVLELDTEYIRNAVTQATSHPRIVLPEGFIVRDAALLSSRRFVLRDGVRYDHGGKYAAFGFFSYAGP